MNFSDQKFEIIPNNKIEINTYVDGNGPLIIFAHGWPESWYSWRYQITYFVEYLNISEQFLIKILQVKQYMWFFHSITLKISMIEDNIWEKDPEKYIIGSDEVGRGSFAGPICASAVKINYNQLYFIDSVKDSKKLKSINIDDIQIANSEFEIEYKKKIFTFKESNLSIKENSIKLNTLFDENKRLRVNLNNIYYGDGEIKNLKYNLKLDGNFNYDFKKIYKTKIK